VKSRFLVDPARNFTVVRKSSLIQFPSKGDWIEYYWLEGTDYEEKAPGIWLPANVVCESYSTNKNGSKTFTVRHTVSNKSWKANPDCTDGLFTLKFPSKLFVVDYVNGLDYEVGDVSNLVISRHAEADPGTQKAQKKK
jgi:hypothetical protein